MNKKYYTTPTTTVVELSVKRSVLITVSNGEAAQGSYGDGNGVNFSREFSFSDEE